MTLSPQNKQFFSDFSFDFWLRHIFQSELRRNSWRMEMDLDNLYDIFCIGRTFLRILSFDLLNSMNLLYVGFKFKYSFKMHLYLIAVGLH